MPVEEHEQQPALEATPAQLERAEVRAESKRRWRDVRQLQVVDGEVLQLNHEMPEWDVARVSARLGDAIVDDTDVCRREKFGKKDSPLIALAGRVAAQKPQTLEATHTNQGLARCLTRPSEKKTGVRVVSFAQWNKTLTSPSSSDSAGGARVPPEAQRHELCGLSTLMA